MRIAVTGGKGGTGKSMVAVNLALTLAKKYSVTLVDADVDCPNDHILMSAKLKKEMKVDSFVPAFDLKKCTACGKCEKSCHVNAIYLIQNKPKFFDKICTGCMVCKTVCPVDAIHNDAKTIGYTYETDISGLRLVTGSLIPTEPISAKVVCAVKERADEKDSDITIIDTAAGTHCTVVEAIEGADHALVVTEPTPFGESDMKRIVDVLDKLSISYDTIVNRSDISDHKIQGMTIPYDERIIESYAQGEPLVLRYPDHHLSKIFYKLGEKICKEL